MFVRVGRARVLHRLFAIGSFVERKPTHTAAGVPPSAGTSSGVGFAIPIDVVKSSVEQVGVCRKVWV